jgi:mannose-1-phosphate guanylyltransferase/mannose-6-phosphate isomerase
MTKIIPVVLAGGSGTRMWPVSRKSYPKQFSKLTGETSIYQQTASRLSSSNILQFDELITITNSEYRFIVSDQLQSIGIDPGKIFIEPEGKNTAPAILVAALNVIEIDSEAVLLVAPSDHIIPNESAFHEAVLKGIPQVLDGKICTFGIKPTHPETGYGYLKLSTASEIDPVELKGFIEKPNEEKANEMVISGNYLWNAGIFMFRAKDMIAAFETYNPDLLDPVLNPIKKGKADLGFFRLDPVSWSACKNVSIDYAVMEFSNNLVAVPFSAGWSDVGDWSAVWELQKPDKDGIVLSENAYAIECKNCLLRSESANQVIVGLGVEDIIAVAMPDAVLIADKNKSQDVKKIVESLKLKKIPQAEVFPKDHRPWGWIETLTKSTEFLVRRIMINPNNGIGLQSHQYRAEHWVVVEGTSRVTLNDKINLVTEGQSVYVPENSIHKIENPGKVNLVLIEIQTGQFLIDDTARYDNLCDN